MEFIIEASALQKMIKLLGVVAKANKEDVEGQVLIESTDEGLNFLVNNGQMQLSSKTTEVKIEESGSMAVSYGKLKSFALSFSVWNETNGVKDFKFTSESTGIKVTTSNNFENGKKSRSSLKLRQYDPYRIARPKPFSSANFTLPSQVFKSAANKVLYAINPDISHVALSGMYLKFDDKFAYFVGSDGTKLSEYKVKSKCDLENYNVIFGYSYVMALRRLLSDEAQMFFELDEGKIKTMVGDVCLYGRSVVASNYPEYENIFNNYTDSVVLDKDIILSGLMPMVDALDSDDNNRMSIEIKDKKLTFSCPEANFSYTEDLDYTGEFVVDINGKFVIQTIESINDIDLLMMFSDSNNCIMFDSNNYKDQRALIQNLVRR